MTTTAHTQEAPEVGVLGVGRMGLPIVNHLVRSGYSTVAFDPCRTKAALVEARGAVAAQDPGEVARRCSVVLVCVGSESEVDAILADDSGFMEEHRRGALVAVLSTVSPMCMQRVAAQVTGAGIDVIDAPVCRGGSAADAGELLTFLGGADALVARFRPIAETYSSDVVPTGPIGSGQAAKAVNNVMLWACLVGSHEGLALARRFGLDIEVLRQALLTSSAANWPLSQWNEEEKMIWADKDMQIVSEMAGVAGISLPQAGVDREICRVLKHRVHDLDRYGL